MIEEITEEEFEKMRVSIGSQIEGIERRLGLKTETALGKHRVRSAKKHRKSLLKRPILGLRYIERWGKQ